MRYKLENENIKIEINDLGAELISLKKTDSNIEYIWQGNPDYWKRSAPILFPFVGKLKDDKYEYKDKIYNMTQHGFARDYIFKIEKNENNYLEFKFSNNEKTLEIYPFEFDLFIGYKLDKNKLEISYKVVNKTDGEMYFSIGAHPAFNWPLSNEKKTDYYFELKNVKEISTYPILKEGISSDKTLVSIVDSMILLNDDVFRKDALIFDDLEYDYICLKNIKNDLFVEMEFKGFPYIGLWSKPTGAPFICLEPWYGIGDFISHSGKLEEKKGVEKLLVGEVFKSSYSLKI